jgi:glycine/D-amino acid oxidase-like deaminating enzyme
MAGIVVVGGGIGGVSVALLLGREGHQVTVCERDPAPAPGSAEDAWTAWRGEPRWHTMRSGIGLIDGVLLPAADHDAEVYRALYRWEVQLDPATDLEANTVVIERARQAAGDAAEPPLDTAGIPSREQLLEAIAAVG